eukprot:gene33410-42860_t
MRVMKGGAEECLEEVLLAGGAAAPGRETHPESKSGSTVVLLMQEDGSPIEEVLGE